MKQLGCCSWLRTLNPTHEVGGGQAWGLLFKSPIGSRGLCLFSLTCLDFLHTASYRRRVKLRKHSVILNAYRSVKNKIKKDITWDCPFPQSQGFSHMKPMVGMALLLRKPLALLSWGKSCFNNLVKYQRTFDPGLVCKVPLWELETSHNAWECEGKTLHGKPMAPGHLSKFADC